MKRLLELIKERGLFFASTVILDLILYRVFSVRISKVSNGSIGRDIFKNRKLKESPDGYFYVYPMPTEAELTTYYSNTYWGPSSEKQYKVSIRDLIHYHLLRKFIPEFFLEKNKVVANFGAGHIGISNLLWFDNFDIINIEPSEIPSFYNSRWTHYCTISEVDDSSIDLIYGSHSLEHVQDIEIFKSEVKRVLKPGGFLFWEVPNAESPSNGAMNNKIQIPHTYYFKIYHPKTSDNFLKFLI